MARASKPPGSGLFARLLSRRRGPSAGDAERALGLALMAALDPDGLDEVERWLADWVRTDSNAIVAYLALARVYRRRGEIGRSIHLHQNLLLRRDLGPEDRVTVLAELAQDFRKGGFLDRAVASFEEVLAHQPRHREALRALVTIQTDLRNHPAALTMLRRLRKLDKVPNDAAVAELMRRMAQTLYEEGQADAARKWAKRALRRNPDDFEAGILLGQLEAERGKDKAALAAWSRVLERGSPRTEEDPGGLGIYVRLEASFASQGRPRDYEVFLRGLLEKRPGDLRAIRALARHLAARGDIDVSLEALGRGLEADPESLALRIERARILVDAGRQKDALDEFRDVLDRVEERSELLERESVE